MGDQLGNNLFAPPAKKKKIVAVIQWGDGGFQKKKSPHLWLTDISLYNQIAES